MKGKLMRGVIVLVLALAVVPLSCSQPGEGNTSTPSGSGIGLGNYSLDGELCIIPASWTTLAIWPTLINWSTLVPSTQFNWSSIFENSSCVDSSWLQPLDVYLKRGEKADIPILLHFDSHNPEITQLSVSIDPTNSSCGAQSESPYRIFDDEDNEIGRGSIYSEEVISYNMTGTVVIESGGMLPLTMTVRVPEDLPKRISKSSFRIGTTGICPPPHQGSLRESHYVSIEVHIVD